MKGKITKLTPYPSGKGYFIGINGLKPDYMFFGGLGKEIKEGMSVVFDTGRPSADGKPTIKSIRLESVEAFIDEDKPRSAPIPPLRAHDAPKADAREEYWKAKEKRDIEREPIITRLSCISSAATVIAAAHENVSKSDKDASFWVIEMAKKFEKYAQSGE